jgi:energy-coupling factor transporter ATP-binding protein EcfA2
VLNTQRQQFRIRRLELHNIRCFENVTIGFCDEASGEPAPWTVILGDNGSGKSTVLKSIALMLSTPKDARGMFEAHSNANWLRRDCNQGSIILEFDTGQGSPKQERVIKIGHRGSGESIEWDSSPPGMDAVEDIPFLCGYGATRRSFGTSSSRGYSSRNAVATLFDADAPLQNPELSLRRTMSEGQSTEDLLRIIDDLLMLPHGSTRLGREGLEVSGAWGSFLPVADLSDGYRATLAWIMDMIGWALQKSSGVTDGDLQGTVLIDEIEQHLHPSWQRHIIGRLRDQFPGLNVILTTHSPLCVVGTTDLEDANINLVHLRWDGEVVAATHSLKPPRGRRADQILTSYLFGLRTTGDNRTKDRIHRLADLLSKGDNASTEERREKARLQIELDKILGERETEIETTAADHIQQALFDTLTDRVTERIRSAKAADGENPGIDLEVRRQLGNLFERGPA